MMHIPEISRRTFLRRLRGSTASTSKTKEHSCPRGCANTANTYVVAWETPSLLGCQRRGKRGNARSINGSRRMQRESIEKKKIRSSTWFGRAQSERDQLSDLFTFFFFTLLFYINSTSPPLASFSSPSYPSHSQPSLTLVQGPIHYHYPKR